MSKICSRSKQAKKDNTSSRTLHTQPPGASPHLNSASEHARMLLLGKTHPSPESNRIRQPAILFAMIGLFMPIAKLP